jgi:tetratricopeptide (TPR) repeat protein
MKRRRIYTPLKVLLFCAGTLALGFFAGPAAAQQGRCQDLTSLKPTSMNRAPKSADGQASDNLVAEGRAATRIFSHDSVARSISLFEQAVRTDPQNASAYIYLARAHTQSQRYMSVPKKIARARAWENLSKGRELDPSNIDGLHLLADQIVATDHDYKCAKKILETALRLDPKNARSNHYYSQLLSGMGKFDLAFEYADKALALADRDTRSFVLTNSGRPRYMAGQYDWVLTKYLEATPDAPLAHFYRSLAYGAKGMFPEALAEAKKYEASDRARDAGGVGMIALAYANVGRQDKARELLNELLARDARGEHVVEYRIAAVDEVLGQRDEAVRWLEKQIEDSDGLGTWLLWLNYDPVWKEMRKDPRWKTIQKRAGW